MPGMEYLYEQGRKRWDEYAKGKRASKREEQALAHQQAMEKANLQYGPGSPAMITAQTGRDIYGQEYGPGGLKQRGMAVKEGELALKPWQAAARWDIENRKLQKPVAPRRADIEAIYNFEAGDEFDAADPQWIAKANTLRGSVGMPLWVKSGEKREGLGIPIISPSRTMPMYRLETREEYQKRTEQGQPTPSYGVIPRHPPVSPSPGLKSFAPGGGQTPTITNPPVAYNLGNEGPAPEIRRINEGTPPYWTQFQPGEGYMKVEGQQGYYELKRPRGRAKPGQRDDWRNYNY